MVAKEYRVFGPALQVMRSVIAGYHELGFDFIYTVPNADSVKVCQRAGFAETGTIHRFAKVLNPGYELQKKKVPPLMEAIAAPAVNLGFRFVSKETYRDTGLVSGPENGFGGHDFPVPRIENSPFFIAHRDVSYLRWRYLDNPLYPFSVVTYKGKRSGTLDGYVVSVAIGKTAHIFDVIFDDSDILEALLVQFSKDMRMKGYASMSVRLLEGGPFLRVFEKVGFRPRGDSVPLLSAGDRNLLQNKWFFTDGDRNV